MNKDYLGLLNGSFRYIKKSLASVCVTPNVQDAPASASDESIASYYKNHPIAQEEHHARHALSFFSFMIWQTLKGKRVRRRVLSRILHHLTCLREFLEDAELSCLVNSLCVSIQSEYDQSLNIVGCYLHKAMRKAAMIVARREGLLFSNLSSILMECCERQKKARICMYPWLVANEDKILEFAKYYGGQLVFEGLIPKEEGGLRPPFRVI